MKKFTKKCWTSWVLQKQRTALAWENCLLSCKNKALTFSRCIKSFVNRKIFCLWKILIWETWSFYMKNNVSDIRLGETLMHLQLTIALFNKTKLWGRSWSFCFLKFYILWTGKKRKKWRKYKNFWNFTIHQRKKVR